MAAVGCGLRAVRSQNVQCVLIDPDFGFRLFGFGPILQCIDAGVVVLTQGEELGIFRHETIYAIPFIWKSLSNIMGFVIHSSYSHS